MNDKYTWNLLDLSVNALEADLAKNYTDEDTFASLFGLNKLESSPISQALKSSNKKVIRSISKVVLNNGVIIIATTDNFILRWNIDQRSELDEIEVARKTDDNTISNLFLDPTGNHLIISLKNCDNFYLHRLSNKPKRLSKLNSAITSIAFDRKRITENSTKILLIGTSTGAIYELSIDSAGKEKNLNQLYQLESSISITSLHFEFISSTATTTSNNNVNKPTPSSSRIFLMAVTSSPTRLYHFLSNGSTFSQLFAHYSKVGGTSFTELPGTLPVIDLHCYHRDIDSPAQHFAFMTQLGVYLGSISYTISQNSSESMFVDAQLMQYDTTFDHNTSTTTTNNNNSSSYPIAISLSEYHVLLLREGRLTAISRVSGETAQDDSIDSLLQRSEGEEESVSYVAGSGSATRGQSIVGLTRDTVRNTHWMYSPQELYQLVPLQYHTNNNNNSNIPASGRGGGGGYGYTTTSGSSSTSSHELWNIWRQYLKKGVMNREVKYFELALQMCQNEDQRALVHRYYAAYYLQRATSRDNSPSSNSSTGSSIEKQKDLEFAAPHLARALGVYFEDVAVWLSVASASPDNTGSNQGLQVYLEEKLSLLPSSAKVIRGLLGIWLVEIYIHKIVMAELQGEKEVEMLMSRRFKDFVRTYRQILDMVVLKGMLVSKGLESLLLHILINTDDIDGAVTLLLENHRYSEALSLLSMDLPMDKISELIIKTSSVLILVDPESTLNLLLSKSKLEVLSVLPSLLQYVQRVRELQPVTEDSKELQRLMTDRTGKTVHFVEYYLYTTLTRIITSRENPVQIPPAVLIHTYFWICAEDQEDKEEKKLLEWLEPMLTGNTSSTSTSSFTHSNSGGLTIKMFSLPYVLRLLSKYKKSKSMVILYQLLYQYEEALKLAVTFDIQLAKIIANRPEDKEVRRFLWLTLAKTLLHLDPTNNIAITLQLINDSHQLLTIDTVLPLLPDTADISHFREEVRHGLENNMKLIEDLKLEIEETNEAAEGILREMDHTRIRGINMSVSQSCMFCTEIPLCVKPFYVFPCGHASHCDCCIRQCMKSSNDEMKQKIKGLEDQIKPLQNKSKDQDKKALLQLETLYSELDGLVATECPLCGEVMVHSIVISLLADVDSIEAKSWEL